MNPIKTPLRLCCWLGLALLASCSAETSAPPQPPLPKHGSSAASSQASASAAWRKRQIEEASHQIILEQLGYQGALNFAAGEERLDGPEYTLSWRASSHGGQGPVANTTAFIVHGDINQGQISRIDCQDQQGVRVPCYTAPQAGDDAR